MKPKVAKPKTISQATVDQRKRQLARLDKDVIAANKRNTAVSNELVTLQQRLYEQQAASVDAVTRAQIDSLKPAPELDPSMVAGVAADSRITSAVNADNIESNALAMLRRTQAADDYNQRMQRNRLQRSMLN